MTNVLRRLWTDDRGAVISVELILVIGILIFGIIPGLVAMRNSINAALGTIGNILTTIVPSFTFSGFAIGGNAPANCTIAQVQGFLMPGNNNTFLTASQLTPIFLNSLVVIPPAPCP